MIIFSELACIPVARGPSDDLSRSILVACQGITSTDPSLVSAAIHLICSCLSASLEGEGGSDGSSPGLPGGKRHRGPLGSGPPWGGRLSLVSWTTSYLGIMTYATDHPHAAVRREALQGMCRVSMH